MADNSATEYSKFGACVPVCCSAERRDRMKQAHYDTCSSKSIIKSLAKPKEDTDVNSEFLLDKLSASLDPLLDQTMQRALCIHRLI